MRKRISFIIKMVVVALIVGLIIWRFWPQSASHLMPVDENAVTGFAALALVGNGLADNEEYRIDSSEQLGNEPGEIVEILATSNYRPDFRNLLPWGVTKVNSGRKYDGYTVFLDYLYAENKYISVTFFSSSTLIITTDEYSRMRIYHPTNSETLDKLVEYLKTHNTDNISAEKTKGINNDEAIYIVNIRDRAKEERFDCPDAVEKFYEDEMLEYCFSAIKSDYIMVTYNNGDSEDIVAALNAGRATIADLDRFGIDYFTRPKK